MGASVNSNAANAASAQGFMRQTAGMKQQQAQIAQMGKLEIDTKNLKAEIEIANMSPDYVNGMVTKVSQVLSH